MSQTKINTVDVREMATRFKGWSRDLSSVKQQMGRKVTELKEKWDDPVYSQFLIQVDVMSKQMEVAAQLLERQSENLKRLATNQEETARANKRILS
jgi:uncharacterized protein YukE